MKDISTLTAYLDKFTNKVIANVEKVQQETAKQIQQDVMSNAPVETGNYAKSIKVSPTEKKGNTIETKIYTDVTVSTLSGKTYNLGSLLENGTEPHDIVAINAGGLFWGLYDNGVPIIRKKVHHPGTVAQPHFRPALEKNERVYLDNIAKAVKEAEK